MLLLVRWFWKIMTGVYCWKSNELTSHPYSTGPTFKREFIRRLIHVVDKRVFLGKFPLFEKDVPMAIYTPPSGS